jgi:hypothetical protein
MKLSKLSKLVWVFFALALGTTTLFAQSWRNGKQAGNGPNKNCINQVSGLNDEQKIKINGLKETHQAKMGELRTTMLKNVKAHRDEVKSLLTAEQQKDYDLLQARGNYGNGRGNGNFQGRGQGRGQQFAGNQGCGAHTNRGGGRQGYRRGNRQNQGCFRN